MVKSVLVYTTRTCKVCRQARLYLKEKGVSYEEIDVSGSPANRYKIKKLTGRQRTPVFVIDGEVIPNFDRERLDQLLV
ncbi:MAG: glutathione S-transferase N-terminal domain-containing protein [Candidatus Tectomicrobia bacterium]|nr:glutathione S-transferase N-terminal domain-containing protein [Candidatus Tectomicrobia bacterium]